MQKFVIFFLALVLLLPLVVFARIGVGIGIGKIQIEEPLRQGGIYNFPSLPVLNTGDEPSQYGVSIEYRQNQPQLRPAQEWFSFSPPSFHLEPGKSQSVAVKLILPLETKPGDYFAFLGAHPVMEAKPGASVGVAAAAKMYFTVAPANIWQGIYYRVVSFWTVYAPWTWVVLGVVLLAIIITIFKKHFAFQIGVKKK